MNPALQLSGDELGQLVRLYMMLTFSSEDSKTRDTVLLNWQFVCIHRKHNNQQNEHFDKIAKDIIEGTETNPLTVCIKHFGDVSLSYNPY